MVRKRIPMRVAIAAVTLSLALLLEAQPIPTIRVPVRLVTLPTLVFSGEDRLIPGLKASDFRVFDNGRLQTVTLDSASTPVSIAIAVQVNQDVRAYIPFIARVGSVVETLLVGDSGEAAVIAFSGDVTTVKPFGSGEVRSTLQRLSVGGRQSRMVNAGLRAIALLKERPTTNARVLLFIGQSMDSGSESSVASLQEQAEKENVSIHALRLPEFGRAFVSDTFSLRGLPTKGGGFEAGVDLGKLIGAVNRSNHAEKGTDPFSILTSATGGTQLHFRKQKEMEGAIAALGVELRSLYLLSYSPTSTEIGYHTIRIEVDVAGAKTHARPGYWLSAN